MDTTEVIVELTDEDLAEVGGGNVPGLVVAFA